MMTEEELKIMCTIAATEIMNEFEATTRDLDKDLYGNITNSDLMSILQKTCDKSMVSVMEQYRNCRYTPSSENIKNTLSSKISNEIDKQYHCSRLASLNQHTHLGVALTALIIAFCSSVALIGPWTHLLPPGAVFGDVYDPADDHSESYTFRPHSISSFLLTGIIASASWIAIISISNKEASLKFNESALSACALASNKVYKNHLEKKWTKLTAEGDSPAQGATTASLRH